MPAHDHVVTQTDIMCTRGGIYYDLTYSTYTVRVEDTTYYFSSMMYADKFKQRLQEYEVKTRTTMIYNLTFDILSTVSCALSLYLRTEKRGFRCACEEVDTSTGVDTIIVHEFETTQDYLKYLNDKKMLYKVAE